MPFIKQPLSERVRTDSDEPGRRPGARLDPRRWLLGWVNSSIWVRPFRGQLRLTWHRRRHHPVPAWSLRQVYKLEMNKILLDLQNKNNSYRYLYSNRIIFIN
jgi:hypothetical protein